MVVVSQADAEGVSDLTAVAEGVIVAETVTDSDGDELGLEDSDCDLLAEAVTEGEGESVIEPEGDLEPDGEPVCGGVIVEVTEFDLVLGEGEADPDLEGVTVVDDEPQNVCDELDVREFAAERELEVETVDERVELGELVERTLTDIESNPEWVMVFEGEVEAVTVDDIVAVTQPEPEGLLVTSPDAEELIEVVANPVDVPDKVKHEELDKFDEIVHVIDDVPLSAVDGDDDTVPQVEGDALTVNETNELDDAERWGVVETLTQAEPETDGVVVCVPEPDRLTDDVREPDVVPETAEDVLPVREPDEHPDDVREPDVVPETVGDVLPVREPDEHPELDGVVLPTGEFDKEPELAGDPLPVREPDEHPELDGVVLPIEEFDKEPELVGDVLPVREPDEHPELVGDVECVPEPDSDTVEVRDRVCVTEFVMETEIVPVPDEEPLLQPLADRVGDVVAVGELVSVVDTVCVMDEVEQPDTDAIGLNESDDVALTETVDERVGDPEEVAQTVPDGKGDVETLDVPQTVPEVDKVGEIILDGVTVVVTVPVMEVEIDVLTVVVPLSVAEFELVRLPE